jgi:ankyrin repeat protein
VSDQEFDNVIAACKKGQMKKLKQFVGKHPDQLNRMAAGGACIGTLLFMACSECKLKAVKYLLNQKGIQVNKHTNGVASPLCIASYNGFTKVVRLLLARDDILVNKAADKVGPTPLILACQQKHLDVVQLLLQHKDINVNQAQNNGWTSLISACQFGHLKIVRLLLSQTGIDVDKTFKGKTPLAFAKRYGHTKIVKLLQQHALTMDSHH